MFRKLLQNVWETIKKGRKINISKLLPTLSVLAHFWQEIRFFGYIENLFLESFMCPFYRHFWAQFRWKIMRNNEIVMNCNWRLSFFRTVVRIKSSLDNVFYLREKFWLNSVKFASSLCIPKTFCHKNWVKMDKWVTVETFRRPLMSRKQKSYQDMQTDRTHSKTRQINVALRRPPVSLCKKYTW